MNKIWKIVKPSKYKSIKECIGDLKKKKNSFKSMD